MVSRVVRAPQTGRKMKRLMVLLRILLVYAVILVLLYLFQNRMIYLPSRAGLDEIRHTADLRGLELWPPDGPYRGFLSKNTDAVFKGTVVVFHGNAGSATDRIYYVAPLERLGYRVLLGEYPGYGARTGATGEESFVADGRGIVLEAGKKYGDPVYLWGESLGCGVACALATDRALKIAGIILMTPWNTLPDTAQSHYWFLPARWLVRDRFDNVGNLKAFTGPVAVLIAGVDKTIPNRLSLDLYEKIPSPKRLWKFEGSGHNSWPIDPGLQWWGEVMDFVSGCWSLISA
jgi:pimeloyl-ACP methyl ester carboxylesterase